MPNPEPPGRKSRGRRVRQAAVLWGTLTLGGVGILSAFVLWHLWRRGRLLRDRLGPPRQTRFSVADPHEESESPEPPST